MLFCSDRNPSIRQYLDYFCIYLLISPFFSVFLEFDNFHLLFTLCYTSLRSLPAKEGEYHVPDRCLRTSYLV